MKVWQGRSHYKQGTSLPRKGTSKADLGSKTAICKQGRFYKCKSADPVKKAVLEGRCTLYPVLTMVKCLILKEIVTGQGRVYLLY